MMDSQIPGGWPWGPPPFFALIRGPLAGSGYQVASVERTDESESTTVLLFSCSDKAERYREHRPQGFVDWKVGPVPTWERLGFFLGSLGSEVRYLSVDVENAGESRETSATRGDYRVSLASVLEALAEESDGDGTAPQRQR